MGSVFVLFLSFFFLNCFPGVNTQDPLTDAAAAVVSDIMNGRGAADQIQELFPQQIFTNLNINGNVEAAAAGANIETLVESKITLLNEMHDCILKSYTENENSAATESRRGWARNPNPDQPTPNPAPAPAPASVTPVFDENSIFNYEGYYSAEEWRRTKEQDAEISTCLDPIWAKGLDDSSIVLQHFGGMSGMVRGLFSTPLSTPLVYAPKDQEDSRKLPSFVKAITLQKDVVVLLDLTGIDRNWIASFQEATAAVIGGLYDTDFMQVIALTSAGIVKFECGSDGLYRGTESNKALLLEWVDSLEPKSVGATEGNLTLLFESAFGVLTNATDSSNNADSGCDPVFLFATRQIATKDLIKYVEQQNQELGARLFVYAVQSALDPEGYLGGGMNWELACENDGTWYNTNQTDDLPDQMLQYLIMVAFTREITQPQWFSRFATHGPFDELLMVVSLPVYSPNNQVILGVVSIEFMMTDLVNFIESLGRGFSFAFFTTLEGDLLVHPSYRVPSVVEQLPLFYDVSLIENSPNFIDFVREPLVTLRSGARTVVVDRPLPKGDIGTEGITSVSLQTTFFWSRVSSMPFILTLAYSEADLRSPSFTSNTDVEWISSSRVRPIFNDSDSAEFFPSDFWDSLSYDKNEWLYSYEYTSLLDNFRSFLPDLQVQSLTEVDSDDDYLPDSTFQQPDTIKSFQTFLNNLVTSFNQNPGMLDQVKELGRIGTIFNKLWRDDYLVFCQTDCATDPVAARFMGFYPQSLVVFPGFIDHPLGNTSSFLARFRPWYQRAEANPGVVCIAPPYLDAFFGGKVTTISESIFSDPTLPQELQEIAGVVAVDYPYTRFHATFVERTGCAFDRDLVTSNNPMCYLMDNSALLIFSPDFLNDDFNTFAQTDSDTLPVGVAEPELAQQLFDAGLLTLRYYINFRGSVSVFEYDTEGNPISAESDPIDTPQRLPLYGINGTLLEEMGGAFSGVLAKANGYCTEGSYRLTALPDTNLFLISITGYSRDVDTNTCVEFEIEQTQIISFDTCKLNAQNFPYTNDVCPNADQREEVSEFNRPETGKCDRTPPKERDFVAWGDPAAIAMVIVASLLIFVTLFLWVLVYKYRETPVILMSSPTFIYIQFFGFILGYSNVYLWTGEPTAVQCGMRPWFMSIAFVLVVGPMFAKTYRVWKLFSSGFFVPKIRDTTVLAYVGAMLIFPIIVCIVWCAYEIPSPTVKDDNFDDEKTVYRCDSEDISCRVFEGILLGYCGCLLILGSYFAFSARKASSHFNETRFVGMSIYSITFCGAVGVTLTYVLLGLPIGYYMVFCVTLMLGIVCTTVFVYVPKLYICILRPEKNVVDQKRLSGDSSAAGDVDSSGTVDIDQL